MFLMIVDMRTGSPVTGTLDLVHMLLMAGQLARFYGLPIRSVGMDTGLTCNLAKYVTDSDIAAGWIRYAQGPRLNLFPTDKGVVVVTRYCDGAEMIWRWGPYKNRLRRLVP